MLVELGIFDISLREEITNAMNKHGVLFEAYSYVEGKNNFVLLVEKKNLAAARDLVQKIIK